METRPYLSKTTLSIDIQALGRQISEAQGRDGEIRWNPGGKTDPWDLVESAMGLSIAGNLVEARAAYEWMANKQLPDGCWYAAYGNGIPKDKTKDANMSTYIAVGVLHYYLITGDKRFLFIMWETVEKAIDFALRLQAPGGEIFWAISPKGEVDHMALLTGSCSIYMSIRCALAIAKVLGFSNRRWESSHHLLGQAIRFKPHLFNMTKFRYAMDWFYPVLAGVLTGAAGKQQIDRFWKKYVVNDHGVRCVSDRPWITVAETCELTMTLAAMGNRSLSEIVFNWILDKRYEDGTYWCGYTLPDMAIWPEEKLTWTNAAVLLAADALYHLTPASRLFYHGFWSEQQRDVPV